MKSKYLIFILLAAVLTVYVLAALRLESPPVESSAEVVPEETIAAIAVCPTFYDSVKNLGEEYIIVRTESTAESLQLLDSGKVDFAIGGRTPMPGEEHLEYTVLEEKERFSILYKDSIAILKGNLRNTIIYTDQNIDLIKEVFELTEVREVEDVYEYVHDFVIITSWDNTDYRKASIVHLLESNGMRNLNSRIPILYYREEGDVKGFNISRIEI